MNILTQEEVIGIVKDCLNESKADTGSLFLSQAVEPSSLSYLRFIESISTMSDDIIRKIIKAILEKMDHKFRFSEGRCSNYYVKQTRERTIITIYGDITYKRTEYVSLLDNKPYIYVDEMLKLLRRQRYGNDIKALIYEAYADENSMIKIGKEIGSRIYARFSLCKDSDFAIPRQTVQRFIKEAHEIRINDDSKKEVEELYVLLDEKFIGAQHNDDKDIMCKCALIFEGYHKGKNGRNAYLNKTYFSMYSSDFKYELADFIESKYDITKLKRLYVMGDGATWIKECYNVLKVPGVSCRFGIDKFHVSKSINIITSGDKTLNKNLLSYVINGDYTSFKEAVSALRKSYPNRIEKIDKNYNYICTHKRDIKNAYHKIPITCAMEQAISHHLASEYTSVPKAYCKENINAYLAQRDLYRSGYNLKEVYALALDIAHDEDNIKHINKEKLDLSVFDNNYPLPYYTTDLVNGKKPVKF